MSEETPGWNCSEEAEQSVLGALLLDNAAFDRVADVVREPDFYSGGHRRVFRVMSHMIEAGRIADLVTVSERLSADDAAAFRDLGGPAYLASLAQNTPSSANVRRYAEIVRERSVARQLYGAAQDISLSVTASRGRPVSELVDEAQQRVLEIGEGHRTGRQDFIDTQALLGQVLEFVDYQYHREVHDDVTGLPTGFRDLDIQTTGMQPGQLIIVAARPAMGKSAFALNVAENASRASQRHAAVFNLEMGNRETGLRLLAARSGVNVQRLVTGRINDAEWQRVSAAIGALSSVPMLFHEHAGLTVTDLRALARRAVRERGSLSVIVVDYLQLMLAGTAESNRAMQLAEITRGLKLLAKELQVPVIALSQLNRELEKRVNKRPVMSDLRDSGALEQDADVILFIYRDDYYHPNSAEPGVAEIIIAKQRNGPVGTVRLRFRADRTRFEDEHPFRDAA